MKETVEKVAKCRWYLIAIVMALLLCLFVGRRAKATPYYLNLLNATNGPMTGIVTVQGWPQSSWWSMYGTNAIYTGFIITNTPNASGFFSNWLYPGTYRVQIPSLNTIFYVDIPDTTNYLSLMNYGVAVPATETLLNSYGLITNLLGFGPMTNSFPMLVALMGYTPQPASGPLTNLTAGLLLSVTNQGVISTFDLTGDFYRTNTITHHSLFMDSNSIPYFDGAQWPTNPIQTDLNWSNSLWSQVLTNRNTATNVAGLGGDGTNQPGSTNFTLAFVAPGSASGTSAKITYDGKGRVTGTNSLTLPDLPALSFVGTTNTFLLYSVVTNWFACWMVIQTNANPGTFGLNLPLGSLAETTNGLLFSLTASGWVVFNPNGLTNNQSGAVLGETTYNAGVVVNTNLNTTWPPPGIPPYVPPFTNYMLTVSNGFLCYIWTNNGAGTIGIYYVPTP